LDWPLVSRPDRVQIWAAQLAANDFPPVCAMTGAPAETWRKFRFATAPSWAYVLLLLICTGVGLLIIGVLIWVVSFRASGHLPLTRASRRKLAIVNWLPVALIVLSIVAWIAAAFVGFNSNDQSATIAAGLLIVGLIAGLAGLVGWVVIRRLVGPHAKVIERRPGQYDQLVELRNVHPAFVMAVNQLNLARAAHHASLHLDPNRPLRPGSN
jgi:hypothetical protein